jgi:RNA ligase
MTFIAFPSIKQYKDIIRQVKDNAKYHNMPTPTLTFQGTVKLHGTNAGVVLLPDGTIQVQSRERIITPLDDNAGFAMFVEQNKAYFKSLLYMFADLTTNQNDSVQIYGEWCGGSIQKSVGLNKLSKMFIIFAVRISENSEGSNWLSQEVVQSVITKVQNKPSTIHSSTDFPVFYCSIDFSDPVRQQNFLCDLTQSVEKDCPVARMLLPDSTDELIGEGIVWECISQFDTVYDLPFCTKGLRFKVKGEKHVSSKVKTLAPIDTEKLDSIQAFCDMVLTDSRLWQGVDKMHELGKECTERSTGDYIKWIVGDVLKEDMDALVASGWTTKDVTSVLSKGARLHWFKYLAKESGLK